jgi:hypothetical protein
MKDHIFWLMGNNLPIDLSFIVLAEVVQKSTTELQFGCHFECRLTVP